MGSWRSRISARHVFSIVERGMPWFLGDGTLFGHPFGPSLRTTRSILFPNIDNHYPMALRTLAQTRALSPEMWRNPWKAECRACFV